MPEARRIASPLVQTLLLAMNPSHFGHADGVERSINPATPAAENPVLSPRPGQWDATRCKLYGTVLVDPDDGLFKMWYSGSTDTPDAIRREGGGARHIGYAVSRDGVHWTRPKLSNCPDDRGRPSNRVVVDAQAANVFLQPSAKGDRFLMLAAGGRHTHASRMLTSRDGITWREAREHVMDTGNWARRTHEPYSILYDADEPDAAKRWKGYSLLHVNRNGYRGRAVGLFTARQAARWDEHPGAILTADGGPELEIHLPHVSRFGQTYLMLYDAMDAAHRTHTEGAVSDDGVHFERLRPGLPLLPNGLPGADDAGMICISCRGLVQHDGRWLWYYTASADTYQTAPRSLQMRPWRRVVQLATWRQEGVADFRPGPSGRGTIHSATLQRTSKTIGIAVNAIAVPGEGGVIVEMLDPAGRVAARAATWSGDAIRSPLQWDRPIPPEPQTFTLRITLFGTATRLYAVELAGVEIAKFASAKLVSPPEVSADRVWSVDTRSKMTAGVTAAGDSLLTADWKGNVRALDAATGVERWRYRAANGVAATPAVDGGRALVVSNDHSVASIDITSGRPVWKIKLGTPGEWAGLNPNAGWINAGPAVGDVGPGERWAFVGTHNRRVYAIDTAGGAVRWAYPTSNWIISLPAFHASDDWGASVLFGGIDGHLHALDARCGALRWRQDLGAAVTSAPLIVGNVVYCGADNGRLHAFDVQTGKIIWKAEIGSPICGRPLAFECGRMAAIAVASLHGAVTAVTSEHGTPLWRVELGERIVGGLVRAVSDLAAATVGGRVLLLEPNRGRVRQTVDLNDAIAAPPLVLPTGVLVVATCRGKVVALKPNLPGRPTIR